MVVMSSSIVTTLVIQYIHVAEEVLCHIVFIDINIEHNGKSPGSPYFVLLTYCDMSYTVTSSICVTWKVIYATCIYVIFTSSECQWKLSTLPLQNIFYTNLVFENIHVHWGHPTTYLTCDKECHHNSQTPTLLSCNFVSLYSSMIVISTPSSHVPYDSSIQYLKSSHPCLLVLSVSVHSILRSLC